MSNSQKRRVAKSPVAEARKASRGGPAPAVLVVAGLVVVAVIVGVVVALTRGNGTTTTASESNGRMPANTLDGTSIVMGRSDAKATVDLYVDLQCPACKAYEARVARTLENDAADGKVRLVVHPIAILNDASTTQYSTRAGAAVYCAADAGKYWPYAKTLYANQPPEGGDGLTNDELVDYGKQVGLTSSTFATCVTGQKQASLIKQSTDTALAAGVSATPTIKVNGKQLTQGTLEELEQAVAAAQ